MYSVDYDGKRFIQDSPLGMKTNIGDYTDGLSILGNPVIEKITDSYSLPNIKKSEVNYNANKGELTFAKGETPVFDFKLSANICLYC